MRFADGNSTILWCCCFFVLFLWHVVSAYQKNRAHVVLGRWIYCMHWMLNKFTFRHSQSLFRALSYLFFLGLNGSCALRQYKNCGHTTQIIMRILCDLIRQLNPSLSCIRFFLFVFFFFLSYRSHSNIFFAHVENQTLDLFRTLSHIHSRSLYFSSDKTSTRESGRGREIECDSRTRANKPCNSLF